MDLHKYLLLIFLGLILFVAMDIDAVGANSTKTGSYNQDDQLIKIVKQDGGTIDYSYDDNGNLSQKKTSEGIWNFTYDEEDQLVRVDHHHSGWQGKPPFEVVIVYAYDPAGRRVFKDVDGVRTYYFYTDEGLTEEYDGGGKVIRQYGYAPGSSLPRWVKTATGTYFYYYDHLGTSQKLVDQSGTVVWEAVYDDFGRAQITTEVVENHLRFPGQYFDAETGLHYNWHRYYDPETSRYLTRDPIRDGANDYSYARNNPVNAVDPTGLRIVTDTTIQLRVTMNGVFYENGFDYYTAEIIKSGPYAEMVVNELINAEETYTLKVVVGEGSFYNQTDRVIGLDPNDSRFPDNTEQLAHEYHHAYEDKNKIADRRINPKTGIQYNEEAAERFGWHVRRGRAAARGETLPPTIIAHDGIEIDKPYEVHSRWPREEIPHVSTPSGVFDRKWSARLRLKPSTPNPRFPWEFAKVVNRGVGLPGFLSLFSLLELTNEGQFFGHCGPLDYFRTSCPISSERLKPGWWNPKND